MQIRIIQISTVYDTHEKTDVLYGVGTDGIAYWYRVDDWIEKETKEVVKTKGWVPLDMSISVTIPKKTNETNQPGSQI